MFFDIAEHEVTGRIITFDCGLALTRQTYTRASRYPFHECSLKTSEADVADATESSSTQDRRIAANYMPVPVRPLVIPLVPGSLSELIERARPSVVYRVAKRHRSPRMPGSRSLKQGADGVPVAGICWKAESAGRTTSTWIRKTKVIDLLKKWNISRIERFDCYAGSENVQYKRPRKSSPSAHQSLFWGDFRRRDKVIGQSG
jgi:hypothetical protein